MVLLLVAAAAARPCEMADDGYNSNNNNVPHGQIDPCTPVPEVDDCVDGVPDVTLPPVDITDAPVVDDCVDGEIDIPVENPCPPGWRS